MIHTSKSL
jgi:hypothetical protein